MSRLQYSSKNEKFSYLVRGISLIELLIVIACLAFLLAVIYTSSNSPNIEKMRILCSNHIRTLAFGFTTYAEENNNIIPITSNSNNLNEISKQTVNILPQYMGVDVNSIQFKNYRNQFSESFFCPSNRPQSKIREKFWNSKEDYHTAGYFFIVDTKSGRQKIQGKDSESKQWVTRLDMPKASGTELITDITMSDIVNYKPPEYPLGNFGKIQSKILGAKGFETTSHLINDKKAAGGIIGFLDGHVDWRPFMEMDKRYGDNPVCWW